MPNPASVISDEYFAERSIKQPSGCWEWSLRVSCNGYGQAKVRQKIWMAHRLSWEHFHGPIPDGLIVCHKCDNRKCINPSHLFLGTTQDNVDDKMSKGRFVTTPGVKNGHAKLTDQQVLSIKNDDRSQSAIAADYGISQSNVSLIKRGTAWRHLVKGAY